MLDNSQPLFLNDATDGISWVEHGVKKSQIYKRNSRTGEGAPKIWEYMQELIDKHVEKGHVIGRYIKEKVSDGKFGRIISGAIAPLPSEGNVGILMK